MPYFSIIIPTFNSFKTLAVVLRSILQQTFTDFEILIMDGLSTDNTLEIAKSFNDNRIQIYSEKDNGIYDAMNKGIKLAKGEWLYFLGSDDELYNENILEKIFNNTMHANYHVIYGNVTSTRFNGIYAGEFDYMKLYNQNICHQSIFFNKYIFTVIGNFDLKYKAHADYDHNLRWYLNKKIKRLYINEVIANYADGGFSSQGVDMDFLGDKNYKFVYTGLMTLPKWFLIDLCNKGSSNSMHNILMKSILIILKIRRMIVLRFKSILF